MPSPAKTVRRGRRAVSSLLSAILAGALLAAVVTDADRVDRAERAVAARLSWCGVAGLATGADRARWARQATVSGRSVDVLVVPAPGGAAPAGGFTVVATARPGGGWRVKAADEVTARAFGDCLDR